ncbi:MAG: hypothetical protein D6767_08755, partial [Candidatus Hydrogenedentota bacterium]
HYTGIFFRKQENYDGEAITKITFSHYGSHTISTVVHAVWGKKNLFLYLGTFEHEDAAISLQAAKEYAEKCSRLLGAKVEMPIMESEWGNLHSY